MHVSALSYKMSLYIYLHLNLLKEGPGCMEQSVTCQTEDPGVTSLIPAQSHTFVEIDHKITSTVILLPSTDSRRVWVSYK